MVRIEFGTLQLLVSSNWPPFEMSLMRLRILTLVEQFVGVMMNLGTVRRHFGTKAQFDSLTSVWSRRVPFCL